MLRRSWRRRIPPYLRKRKLELFDVSIASIRVSRIQLRGRLNDLPCTRVRGRLVTKKGYRMNTSLSVSPTLPLQDPRSLRLIHTELTGLPSRLSIPFPNHFQVFTKGSVYFKTRSAEEPR